MTTIATLQPTELWKHFADICAIPHPSFHTEELAAHIAGIGKSQGLETKIDETGNILIKKPGTKGFENKKTVVLQAHIDMVPQKNNDSQHCFETDPIEPRVEGEWVKANKTTLGADNGIGAAAILALLTSDDINHGPIEALFTVEEEVGMTGAFGLKEGFLTGDILLNLDTEDEDELVIGCAGGMDVNVSFPYKTENVLPGKTALLIEVKGLNGGHSGIDINTGRANANMLLCDILSGAVFGYGASVAGINGGNMRNAIPREAHATILIDAHAAGAVKTYIATKTAEITARYQSTESTVEIKTSEPEEIVNTYIPDSTITAFLKAAAQCPSEVISMEPEIEGVVKTSNNISIISDTGSALEVKMLLRSSDDAEKATVAGLYKSLFSLYGAKVELTGSYPGWKPQYDSEILSVTESSYQKIFGKSAKVMVVHAGLECGIIGSTYPRLDMVSFGPTIKHPHSPDEKVHIQSVLNFWNLLSTIVG